MVDKSKDELPTLIFGIIFGVIFGAMVVVPILAHLFMFQHNIGPYDTTCIKLTTAYDSQADIGALPATTVVERCYSYNELKRFALEKPDAEQTK